MNFRTAITTIALSSVAIVAAGAQQGTKPDSSKTKAAPSIQQAGKADSTKASSTKATSSRSRASRHRSSRAATKAAPKDSTKHS